MQLQFIRIVKSTLVCLLIFCSFIGVLGCSKASKTIKNDYAEAPLTISASSVVPVFEGNSTKSFIVLRNDGDNVITDINYYISNNSDGGDKIVLNSTSNECAILLPRSSCQIFLQSPILVSNETSATVMLNVSYNAIGNEYKAKHSIIYKLEPLEANENNKLNSIDSILYMNGNNGVRSTMVYVIVKGDKPLKLTDVKLNNSSFTIEHSNHSIGDVISPGSILSYEVTARDYQDGMDTRVDDNKKTSYLTISGVSGKDRSSLDIAIVNANNTEDKLDPEYLNIIAFGANSLESLFNVGNIHSWISPQEHYYQSTMPISNLIMISSNDYEPSISSIFTKMFVKVSKIALLVNNSYKQWQQLITMVLSHNQTLKLIFAGFDFINLFQNVELIVRTKISFATMISPHIFITNPSLFEYQFPVDVNTNLV